MEEETNEILTVEDELNKSEHSKLSKTASTPKTPEEYEKQIYDLQQLLEISKSLCTTLELKNLIESILYVSMAQMRVIGAGIFILESMDTDCFVLGNNYYGLDVQTSNKYEIPVNSSLITYLSDIERTGKVYTAEELKNQLPVDENLEMILSLEPSLVVPLILKNRLNGILILGEKIMGSDEPFTPYEREEIFTIASLAAVAVNNASLLEQSSTDLMTHLKQKYYFFNILSDRLDYASSHSQELGVIMFDIDFFKRFNDTYGHACGDYVLQSVAKIIKSSIRGEDLASRYGGEEFTVSLFNTSKKDSMLVAERIRKNIENFDFCYKSTHMHVTISGGVSVFSVDNNPAASAKILVDQADQALYISKRSGRNRITYADLALLAAIDQEERDNRRDKSDEIAELVEEAEETAAEKSGADNKSGKNSKSKSKNS